MEKPEKLRAEIEKHLPEIKKNPEKLSMFIMPGRVVASKGTLSHETRFTLSILITDFVGDLDVLNAVIINWLQDNQPDILGPGDTDPNAYTIEAEILGAHSADVLIELKLTERTTVLVDDDGNIEIGHPRNANRKDLMNALGISDNLVGVP